MATKAEINEKEVPAQAPRSLRQVLPSSNPRYNRSLWPVAAPQLNLTIRPWTRIESFSGDRGPLPPGWSEYITPEGDAYYFQTERRIVTPNDPRGPLVVDILYAAFQGLLRNHTTWLTAQENTIIEVYLNLTQPEVPTASDVEYYFVDYHHRHTFWVEEAAVGKLGIEAFESTGALKSALTPEFWTHVDYFPLHRKLDRSAEDELLGLLRHGCIDDMTSPGSTCPYSADECQKFIRILEGFRSQNVESGYRTATVARIWSSIARVRHINSFGLSNPRLDRLQGLWEYTQSQTHRSAKLGALDALTLYLSRRNFSRLTALWNGRVVYQRHWHVFFDDMRADWTRMCMLSLLIFIGDVIYLTMKDTSLLVTSSASVAAASACASLILLQKHANGRLATAPEISQYIMGIEHPQHGLRSLAILFSAPTAMTIYAALFMQSALLIQALDHAQDTAAIVLTTLICCLPGASALLSLFSFF